MKMMLKFNAHFFAGYARKVMIYSTSFLHFRFEEFSLSRLFTIHPHTHFLYSWPPPPPPRIPDNLLYFSPLAFGFWQLSLVNKFYFRNFYSVFFFLASVVLFWYLMLNKILACCSLYECRMKEFCDACDY